MLLPRKQQHVLDFTDLSQCLGHGYQHIWPLLCSAYTVFCALRNI